MLLLNIQSDEHFISNYINIYLFNKIIYYFLPI